LLLSERSIFPATAVLEGKGKNLFSGPREKEKLPSHSKKLLLSFKQRGRLDAGRVQKEKRNGFACLHPKNFYRGLALGDLRAVLDAHKTEVLLFGTANRKGARLWTKGTPRSSFLLSTVEKGF